MTKFDLQNLKNFFRSLQESGTGTKEMKQKLNSVDNFVNWANKKGLLSEIDYKQLRDGIAEIRKKISSIFYRMALNTWGNRLKKGLGKMVTKQGWVRKLGKEEQKTDESLQANVRPWFTKAPAEFDIRHYIGISIILVVIAALGAGAYNQFFKEALTPFAFPVNLTKGGRVLSFQGRLTDSLGNPISTATNLKFKLYNASTAGTTLYDSTTCSITPDSDGIFDVLIGGSSYSPTPPQDVCGTEITENIFSDWPNVYLGITIGADAEATPRQQIANVGYAINAETLRGYPPGSGFSNIPYIDHQGNVIIATSSAGIRNSWASTNFTLSSSGIITVQSAGTGDIALSATESGNITATTGLGTTLFNVLTGNLKVGNGAPGVSLNGEDAYIEGTLEVDGATTLDGALDVASTIQAGSSNITLTLSTGYIDADALGLYTPSLDSASTTVQSPSGLEAVSDKLTLLQGCADNEILKWDEVEDDWNCEADAGGNTAWDTIADPTGAGAIAMAELAQTLDWNTAGTAAAFSGLSVTLTNDASTDVNTQYAFVVDNLNDALSTGTTEALIVIDNSDANEAVTDGLLFVSAGGGFTDFIDTPSSVFKVDGSGNITSVTLDTGQGANELYDMDQNVLTTSAVTFATLDTGQGANELYDMDQNVLTTSNVTFADLASTGNTTLGNATGDTVTSNAASWTFANDTNIALTGGINGLSFDTDTLSIDGAGNRVGIGTTTPGTTLSVNGIISGPSTQNLRLQATGTTAGDGNNGSIYFLDSGGTSRARLDTTTPVQTTTSTIPYTTEGNYTQENMAYSVTLTPSAVSGDITLTLGSGNWNTDARVLNGCRVTGNGGVANLTAAPAAQTTITATTTTNFTDTSAIASGSWYLYCTTFDGSVVKISNYIVTTYVSNVGTFATTSQAQLPQAMNNHRAVTATIGGTQYVYVIGGSASTVYKATIDSSGNVGTFATTNQAQLPTLYYNQGTVTATIGGTQYLYVIGGSSGSGISTVYKATIDSSGNVGTFTTTSQAQLPQAINFDDAVTATIGGTQYLYVTGGHNGAITSTVYKAAIDSSGNVGTFSTTSQGQLPATLYLHNTVTATIGGTGYIYVIGGNDGAITSTVYKAAIDSSGNVGTFTTTSQAQLPQIIDRFSTVTTTIGGTQYLYVTAGTTGYLTTIYKATIDSSGNVGTFSTTSQGQLPQGRYGHSTVIATIGGTQYVYVTGGAYGATQSTVYKATIGPDTTSGSSPTSTYYTAVTSGDQINTSSWTDINSAVVTETLDSQVAYYSFSFDGRTTFSVYDGSGAAWRSIARNNSGTWEYNSNATYGSTTWTTATTNAQNAAISQAMGVAVNRMTGTIINAMTDAQWNLSGGYTSSVTTTIDSSVSLYTSSATQIPQTDSIVFNYTYGYTTLYVGATNTTSADLAEYYVSGDKSIEAGDVVIVSQMAKVKSQNGEEVDTRGVLMKAGTPYSSKLIGIISTNPGILMGSIDGQAEIEDKRMLALSGRVPVKIASSSAPIKVGDFLTSSSEPGKAMKAVKAGYTIGKALQAWTPCIDDSTDPSSINNHPSSNCGGATIEVFVNLGYYEPDIYLTATGELKIVKFEALNSKFETNSNDQNSNEQNSVENETWNVERVTYNVKNNADQFISRIGAYAEIITGKIKTGLLETEDAVINSSLFAKKIISPVVEIEEIQFKSQNLKVKSTSQNSKVSIVNKDDQPTAEFDTENKQTSIFGSLEIKNDQEKGQLSKLIIKGLNDNKVAEFDSSGNATFSGTLTSAKVETTEASISGKLTANQVESENINSLTRELVNSKTDINDIQKFLADIRNQPISDVNTYQDAETMNNLSVTGDTNLYRVFISNSLTTGNLLFEDNKIMSLDFELKLTALSSINLLDGQVIISKTGGLTTKGTLTAQAGIKTNKIEPLNSGENVYINNLETNKIQISDKYLQATSSSSIIAASDNFEENGQFSPAIKTKAETAGIGIIKKQDKEIIVYNDSIKKDSLVYLTPTVNTNGNAIAVTEKEECGPTSPSATLGVSNVCKPYFKVSTSGQRTNDVKFNWLIIN